MNLRFAKYKLKNHQVKRYDEIPMRIQNITPPSRRPIFIKIPPFEALANRMRQHLAFPYVTGKNKTNSPNEKRDETIKEKYFDFRLGTECRLISGHFHERGIK